MKKQQSYQDMRIELDEIVARLQDEHLDIDDATKLYEQGTALIKNLETYLKNAEITVKKVTENTKE